MKANIGNWGHQTTIEMPSSKNSTCPHCGEFSYFCRGAFEKHCATDWINAVVGFTGEICAEQIPKDKSLDVGSKPKFGAVGSVVILCPVCETLFAHRITTVVVTAYIGKNWPHTFS